MLSPEQYGAECDCACYQRFQRDVQHSKFPGAGKKKQFSLIKATDWWKFV
ncbi:hypothetical protein SEEH3547_20164 [Salmonella enterica subsp. enterica serovar Heidelberg str. 75-3547]|nr:hypothetical protein SEEH3547_20164 [Salmonella enterica subsp. enterica serovar Heidelberg str. 75-3547]